VTSSTFLFKYRYFKYKPSSNTNINFDGSSREVQPIRKRKLYYYDPEKSCFPDKSKKEDDIIDNHYEKITKNVNKYFFVEGQVPSGVKGALVVGKKEAESLEESFPRITDRYNTH